MSDYRPEGLFLPDLRPSAALPDGDPRELVRQALVRGDEGVVRLDDGALVTTATLRGWGDLDLRALGAGRLERPLSVEATTTNERSDQYAWVVRVDGAAASRAGPWLTAPLRALLDDVQEQVFALAEEIPTCSTRHERLRRVGALHRLAQVHSDIVLGPILAKYPVLVAETMRLGVEPGPDGNLPVTRLAGGGEELPLSPSEIEKVARTGLVGDNSQLLGGRWVVTSPGVARNALLAAVARTAPREQRRRFLQNPDAFLPDEASFDRDDYADRVIGVGEAELQPSEGATTGRAWGSPQVGLVVRDVGDADVVVAAERVPELFEVLSAALERGEPTGTFDEHVIAATPALVRAIERILDGERPGGGPGRDEDRGRPLALLIAENTVVLDWAPPATDVRPAVSRALPPLTLELQPHQHLALRKLGDLWERGEPGALLCDDMGLGKTLQALTFGAWAAHQVRAGSRSATDIAQKRTVDVPLAIVAPPNLLEGWLGELERRLDPSALPVILWGPSERPSVSARRLVLPLKDFLIDAQGQGVTLEHARVDRERIAKARPDVVLIGYDHLRRLQFAIGQLRFGVLVADEAQYVKDPNSLRSRALRAMNVDFSLAVTGTPIENSWRDLWTLCDFALPGRLGTLREFNDQYPPTGDVRAVGEQLAERLKPVLIRRTRRDVLDQLPPCVVTRVERAMPPDQALAYETVRMRNRLGGGAPLSLLQQLSMTSLHPQQREDLTDARSADAWAARSARTSLLWESLARFRDEGAAVLVFVRSRAMQETLSTAIRLAFDLPFVGVLNGEDSLPNRNRLVKRVEQEVGFRVLLVSPDVGGVGWNLQWASRAVLLERTWNPAKEAQMIARIHRLGQSAPVEVVTPLAVLEGRASFDVVLDALLTDKQALSESVLAPAEVSDEEVTARFRELVDQPVDLPATPSAPPAPPPPRAAPPPQAGPPPAALPPAEPSHPDALALADSASFRERCASQPDGRAQFCLRVVDALLRSDGAALSEEALARALGIPRRRVAGQVSELGFLTRDGYGLVVHDPAASQIRLDRSVLATYLTPVRPEPVDPPTAAG